jgi:hypothetical protein
MPSHGIEMLLVFSFTCQEILNYVTDNDFSGTKVCTKVTDVVSQLAQDEMLEKTSIIKDLQPCRY